MCSAVSILYCPKSVTSCPLPIPGAEMPIGKADILIESHQEYRLVDRVGWHDLMIRLVKIFSRKEADAPSFVGLPLARQSDRELGKPCSGLARTSCYL
jgi:hypothetical protein